MTRWRDEMSERREYEMTEADLKKILKMNNKVSRILIGKVWVSISRLQSLQPESESDYWCEYPGGSAFFESADLAPFLFPGDHNA